MKLLYFTDAMCSWCYGFSPAMKQLKENYPDIELDIVSGGFSPFSKQAVTPEYKEFLEYHWRNVNERSGQYFDHTMKFVSDTFQYDTEPPARALIVIQHLLPGRDFDYLSLLQQSFYVEGKDITQETVLAALAATLGVDQHDFLKKFRSEEMKLKTIQGFQLSRELGVRGFPTLLAVDNRTATVLTHGYQPYESLKGLLDEYIKKTTTPALNTGGSCSMGSCDL